MKINAGALALNTNYQRNRMGLESSMMRLATGDRHTRLGEEPAATISISQRLRHNIHGATASTSGIQNAISYIETANAYMETAANIQTRMMELAASSTDGTKLDADRQSLEVEFQVLKAELSAMTRTSLYDSRQTIGRDTVVSYDGNTDRVKFLLPNGEKQTQIERDFGANENDINGTEIGFDSSEDFTMSRDGRSLYFLGTVTGDAANKVRIKRYDIENHIVYTGADLFDSGDTLFADEDGDTYANGNGTVYAVDSNSLTRTATAVTDISVAQEFSVYNDVITYHRTTDDFVVSYDINAATTTALTGATPFGVGVESAVSASGRYIADENVAGQVRVIDTRTGTSSTLAIGVAGNVNNMQFNEDGDRLYYIDQTDNTIRFVKIETNEKEQVLLTSGDVVARGKNNNSFLGLDLGGASFNSETKFVVSEGNLSVLRYTAADLRLYQLGLANTHVDTIAAANQAIEEIKEAGNRFSAQRAKLTAQGGRFSHVMDGHRAYISNLQGAESAIRDTDIAGESSVMSAFQVKTQAAQAVLAQFNSISQNVLVLLQRL